METGSIPTASASKRLGCKGPFTLETGVHYWRIGGGLEGQGDEGL